MEFMTHEEFTKDNHEYISEFLRKTVHDIYGMSTSLKATLAQFISNTRRGIVDCHLSGDNNYISVEQLIEIQIKALRCCIIDLQQILSIEDTIQ